jgi:hypothetical protein
MSIIPKDEVLDTFHATKARLLDARSMLLAALAEWRANPSEFTEAAYDAAREAFSGASLDMQAARAFAIRNGVTAHG